MLNNNGKKSSAMETKVIPERVWQYIQDFHPDIVKFVEDLEASEAFKDKEF